MKLKEYDYAPIGKRIKKAREAKHLTQEQLAEKIDKANQHISEIERGVSGLSISSLMDICIALEVESDYILFGKITDGKNNPINGILKQLNPRQILYAEELLAVYAKSCLERR